MWAMMEKFRVSSVDMGVEKFDVGAARESTEYKKWHEK